MNELELLTERIKTLEDRINKFEKSDRYSLIKTVQMLDGRNIQVGVSTGTKIGTASTQKLAVFGATPVVQASAISAPTGGTTIDSQARAAINSLITAVKNFGITA